MANQGYTLSKSGVGTLIISGPQTNAANSAIAVSAGTLLMNSDSGSSSAASLAFSQSGGTTIFNTAQHLASFNLSGGTASIHTQGPHLLTYSASVTGQLDLRQNDLIDDYTGTSPLGTIRTAIKTGYNSGQWNGAWES